MILPHPCGIFSLETLKTLAQVSIILIGVIGGLLLLTFLRNLPILFIGCFPKKLENFCYFFYPIDEKFAS
ncbi:hypothetical protein BREVNS_0276 [Brevinematales bacterium NS]|nr:hypothetical protein BREVNS_0276 [Brevinematales bacterium NS]